jgi:hypothetical protein
MLALLLLLVVVVIASAAAAAVGLQVLERSGHPQLLVQVPLGRRGDLRTHR